MARLWTTGFETGSFEFNGAYSTTGASTPLVTTAAKRTGSYSIRLRGQGAYPTGTGSFFRQTFDASKTTLYGRFALYMESTTAAETVRILTFNDANAAVQWEFRYNQGTACIDLKNGAGTTVAVGNVIIPAATWVVIEFYALIDASGQIVIKINGTTDISYSGNTDYTGAGNIRSASFFCGVYTSSVSDFFNLYVDDIAINDTEGSYENSWPGLGGVFWLYPDADGAQNDWTPSAGTVNYAMVDDIPPDNATTFNQALDSGNIDLYEVDDCPEYIAEVNVVQVAYRAALVTSGYNELTDLVRVGTVNYQGTEHTIVPITPSFTYYLGTPYYLNPGSGSAWGTAEVNAMQVGVEITT